MHLGENFFPFNRQDTVSMLSKLKDVRLLCFHVSFNLNCHTTHTSLLPATVCFSCIINKLPIGKRLEITLMTLTLHSLNSSHQILA